MDEMKAYTITNATGIKASFCNYGQRLLSLHVPDRQGYFEDVVLGYSGLDEYLENEPNYYGSFVGRCANRISDEFFKLDGKSYQLEKNHGAHHIHGGFQGFDKVFWNVAQKNRAEIDFFGTSPHLDQGYPGNLEVSVKYTLTDENALVMAYRATTDATTHVNFTHHSFFNLKGVGKGDIKEHLLTIYADAFTEINENLLPTGKLLKVDGTPLDFRKEKPIGKHLDSDDEQLRLAIGFDHNYVLQGEGKNDMGLILAAKVLEPQSGRVMQVFTDTPGMQFYSGNFLDGTDRGKGGTFYEKHSGFCLETQYFPDSPNQPNFPSTLLRPGEIFESKTVYQFSVDS